MKNTNVTSEIMLQATRFVFSYLGKRENAPITGSFMLLAMMGYWNVWQVKEHSFERYNWQQEVLRRDSLARIERVNLYRKVGDQAAEILICRETTARLEIEIEALKKAKK